jgi:hypothetical protein
MCGVIYHICTKYKGHVNTGVLMSFPAVMQLPQKEALKMVQTIM